MSVMLAFGRFVCRGLISLGVGVVASSEKETEILGLSPPCPGPEKTGSVKHSATVQGFKSYKCQSTCPPSGGSVGG